MPLDIHAVHQSQRPEFIFRKLTVQISLDLVSKLSDSLIDYRLVVFVVLIHRGKLYSGFTQCRPTANDSRARLCDKEIEISIDILLRNNHGASAV